MRSFKMEHHSKYIYIRIFFNLQEPLTSSLKAHRCEIKTNVGLFLVLRLNRTVIMVVSLRKIRSGSLGSNVLSSLP